MFENIEWIASASQTSHSIFHTSGTRLPLINCSSLSLLTTAVSPGRVKTQNPALNPLLSNDDSTQTPPHRIGSAVFIMALERVF